MNENEHDAFRSLIHRVGGPPLDLEEAQRLKDHLAGCPNCQFEANEWARLDAVIRRTFHDRWDRIPGPNQIPQKSLELAIGQAKRSALGIMLKRAWQMGSAVAGMVLLVVLLSVGALFASKALPARQPMPGPVVSIRTVTPETTPTFGPAPTKGFSLDTPKTYVVQAGDTLQSIANRFSLSLEEIMTFNGMKSAAELRVGQTLRLVEGAGMVTSQTPVPTKSTEPELVRLAELTCAGTEPLPDLLELKFFSGRALVGSGLVQSGDFKIGLWLACDPGFTLAANENDKISELAGLGIYYTLSYSGPEQKGMTVLYAGFEPSIKQLSGFGPTLRVDTTAWGSRGFSFSSEYAPDWSQDRVALRFIIKVQSPDGRLQGADLRFDLVGSPDGFSVQNLVVTALPTEALSDVNAGIAQKPAYGIRQPETLDPLLVEMDDLIQKWAQKMGKGPGWVHLLTENEPKIGGKLPDGSLAPAWTQNDDWYLLDENNRRISAINRVLDPLGNELQVSVLRDGFWDNLTYSTHNPDDPTTTFSWVSGTVKSFSGGAAKGGKLSKTLSQTPDGQPRVIFQVIEQERKHTIVFDAQTGQPLEWILERISDGASGSGTYTVEQHMTYRIQERVDAPPEAILKLLGQAIKPFQPAAPQGKPAPAGFDPAHSTLSLKSVMGDDFNAPTFWYGDLSADGYLLGRVNFGALPGGRCDRSPDSSKIAFSYDVQNSETSIISTLRWLDLKDVTLVYDPLPQLHLVSPITWGPDNRSLAFSAGQTDQDLALIIYDIQSKELRRVGKAGFGPLMWSPDGQYLAQLEEKAPGSFELAVYWVADGTETYRGKWDNSLWQPAGDAPILAWGVKMPRNINGFDRCVNP